MDLIFYNNMSESYYGEIDKKFILTKKIGSGGTSKVYLAYGIKNPKELFAVKIIKPSNSSESKVFNNEIDVLKKIKHENVVMLVDGGVGILTKDTGKKYEIQYLVLELIKYGELFDYIFFPQKGFGEEIGKYILHQLIEGLDAVHKAGISHRDMKTENIMLGENWTMKLADFGFSTKTEGKKGTGLLYTALGTASYASPELLQKKPYKGVPSDIFSLGVSLFVLVTGKMPFKHALVDDPYYKEIVKGNYDNYWNKLESKVPSTTKEFKNLFVKLIAYDPDSRPSLDNCRSDVWMKDFKPNMEKINSEFIARTQLVQYKKELERKKEEQEELDKKKNQNQNFMVYKGHQDTENEDDNSEEEDKNKIKEMEENSLNPYVLNFAKENDPVNLLEYIYFVISSKNKKIDLLKVQDEYKIAIGVEEDNKDPEKDITLGGEVLHETVEALLEVKKLGDGLAIEFTRTLGNKNDFHSLFNEVNALLSK